MWNMNSTNNYRSKCLENLNVKRIFQFWIQPKYKCWESQNYLISKNLLHSFFKSNFSLGREYVIVFLPKNQELKPKIQQIDKIPNPALAFSAIISRYYIILDLLCNNSNCSKGLRQQSAFKVVRVFHPSNHLYLVLTICNDLSQILS